MAANTYFYAIGRRKSSTARIRLQGGKGTITVNSRPAAEYFAGSAFLLNELQKPFIALQEENRFDISAVVTGGGHAGQVDAIRLGVSKALVLMNGDLRGARKQRQFTKR